MTSDRSFRFPLRRILRAAVLGSVIGSAWADTAIDFGTVVAPFSTARPGSALPAGWETVIITAQKRRTHYELVDDSGVTVLHAHAENAASSIGHPLDVDLASTPVVAWRWKVSALINGADNRVAAREDAPARLVFEFDGDKSRLGLGDRAVDTLARNLGGRELPYATLMYIWSNDVPVGTVIPNPRTKRVQMIVASSGPAAVGHWQARERDLLQDYQRAFGQPPGRLRGVAVLTDTDNTGGKVEAWYGDIRFLPSKR